MSISLNWKEVERTVIAFTVLEVVSINLDTCDSEHVRNRVVRKLTFVKVMCIAAHDESLEEDE